MWTNQGFMYAGETVEEQKAKMGSSIAQPSTNVVVQPSKVRLLAYRFTALYGIHLGTFSGNLLRNSWWAVIKMFHPEDFCYA